MQKKVAVALAGAALGLFANTCQSYGEEGHSIIAEIAQRRLDPAAQAAVTNLLQGATLSSVASWADDVKYPADPHPESYNWHFVDIALLADTYKRERDCAASSKGDCIVEELKRLRTQLACAPTVQQRREAIEFAVHFVGDIHQPFHTVNEKVGANQQLVTGTVYHGAACGKGGCVFDSRKDPTVNLHEVWDTGLIRAAFYDWGAYVAKLENGVLKNDLDVRRLGESLDPEEWANDTHRVAQSVWPVKAPNDPGNDVFTVDDAYYDKVMPQLDRRLAVAGLRLAAFLNEAYSSASCEVVPKANLGELKAELADYYTRPVESGSTRYELAQAQVAKDATQFLLARLAERKIAKPALVLDIDETSLNNLEQLQANDFGYIRLGPCTLVAGYACAGEDWDKTMRATAIKPTLALYKAASEHGVAVFFVTGRRDENAERAYTAANLEKAGYTGYKGLLLRPPGAGGGASVSEYKSRMRASIEADGYHIVVNMGDQQSDLAGGHAERGFLMPNPAYSIP